MAQLRPKFNKGRKNSNLLEKEGGIFQQQHGKESFKNTLDSRTTPPPPLLTIRYQLGHFLWNSWPSVGAVAPIAFPCA